MTVPRASYGMLRSRLRPAPGPAPLRPAVSRTQTQQNRSMATIAKDDLGGPGGQEPPPRRPGGPEAVKRNWAPIGGAALAVAAALAYITGNGPRRPPPRDPHADIQVAAQTEIGELPPPTVSEETRKKWEGKEIKGLDELSGRKSGGYGAFRSE